MKPIKITFQVIADQLKKEFAGIKRFTSDVTGWTRLKQAADKYGKSVVAVGVAFKGLRSVGSAAFKVLGAGFKAFRNVVLIGIGAVTGFGAASLKSAADIEKLKLRLEGVTGSAKKADDIFKETYKFFLKSPFELEPLVEARILLEGLGITGSAAFTSVANAAAIMDRDITDVASAVGSMEAEPLRRMGINLNSDGKQFLFEYIDKMGKIHNIASKTRRGAQQELLKIFDIKFGGSIGKLSQTWYGLVSTFEGSMKGAFAEVGAGLLPVFKPILSKINDGIQGAIESGKLQKWGETLGAWIQKGVINLTAGIQTAIDMLRGLSLGDAIGGTVSTLTTMAITLLGEGLLGLGRVLVVLAKVFATALSAELMKVDIWGRNEDENALVKAFQKFTGFNGAAEVPDYLFKKNNIPDEFSRKNLNKLEATDKDAYKESLSRLRKLLDRLSLDAKAEIATSSRDSDILAAIKEFIKGNKAAFDRVGGVGENIKNDWEKRTKKDADEIYLRKKQEIQSIFDAAKNPGAGRDDQSSTLGALKEGNNFAAQQASGIKEVNETLKKNADKKEKEKTMPELERYFKMLRESDSSKDKFLSARSRQDSRATQYHLEAREKASLAKEARRDLINSMMADGVSQKDGSKMIDSYVRSQRSEAYAADDLTYARNLRGYGTALQQQLYGSPSAQPDGQPNSQSPAAGSTESIKQKLAESKALEEERNSIINQLADALTQSGDRQLSAMDRMLRGVMKNDKRIADMEERSKQVGG